MGSRNPFSPLTMLETISESFRSFLDGRIINVLLLLLKIVA